MFARPIIGPWSLSHASNVTPCMCALKHFFLEKHENIKKYLGTSLFATDKNSGDLFVYFRGIGRRSNMTLNL